MKKIFSIFMLVFMTALCMNAQNTCGSSRFWDNWAIGLGGGVGTNLHDWSAPQGGNATLILNKDITPIFGITLEGNVGFNNNANWLCHKYVAGTNHEALSHGGTIAENVTAFVNGRVNFMNAFGKYRGVPRVFELEGVVGGGYGRAFDFKTNAFLFNTGLNLNFFLDNSKSCQLSLQPRVVWDVNHSKSHLNSHKAIGQLNIVFVYHFKNSNGQHFMTRQPIYSAPTTIERVVEVEKIVKVPSTPTEVKVSDTFVVTFDLNSSTLSDSQKTILDNIAKGSTVDIIAYASPDGNAQYNKELSVKRAESVAEYLKSRGVTIGKSVGNGADGVAGRIAIVTIQ